MRYQIIPGYLFLLSELIRLNQSTVETDLLVAAIVGNNFDTAKDNQELSEKDILKFTFIGEDLEKIFSKEILDEATRICISKAFSIA